MTRSFDAVVAEVVRAVPPGPENAELIAALERERNNAGFQPPESPIPWQRLAELLEDFIGEPSHPWHVQIADIVTGRTAP